MSKYPSNTLRIVLLSSLMINVLYVDTLVPGNENQSDNDKVVQDMVSLGGDLFRLSTNISENMVLSPFSVYVATDLAYSSIPSGYRDSKILQRIIELKNFKQHEATLVYMLTTLNQNDKIMSKRMRVIKISRHYKQLSSC